jgi:hypothetical protein
LTVRSAVAVLAGLRDDIGRVPIADGTSRVDGLAREVKQRRAHTTGRLLNRASHEDRSCALGLLSTATCAFEVPYE